MKITPNDNGYTDNPNKSKNLVPQGTHTARIVLVAYVGSCSSFFGEKETKKDTLIISYELCDEQRETQDGPIKLILSKEYTFSYGSRSFLRKDIEALISRTLSDNEVDYKSEELFNVQELLGIPASITVVHKNWTSKNGKSGVNVNITNVAAIPKNFEEYVAKPQRELIKFSIKEFSELSSLENDATFKKLNKYVLGYLTKSEDYKTLVEMATDSDDEKSEDSSNVPNSNNTVSSENNNNNLADDLPF